MRCVFSLIAAFVPFALAAQHDDSHQTPRTEQVEIAVLVYEDIVLQDFAGPLEVFSKARNLTQGKYEVITVALSEGPIETENGLLEIIPDYTVDEMPHAEYLVVPGASMRVIEKMLLEKTVRDFLSSWAGREDKKTVSICTASYLLADTGLLNGRTATTHYFVADDFSNRFPEIDVVRDVRFVEEDRFLTSSGIDAALYIVGENSGTRIRDMISRALQYEYHIEEAWPVAPNGMKYEGPYR